MGPERGPSTIYRGCELEAGSSELCCLEPSAIGHGLHVADRAQGLTETKRGKVPSAASVTCIARSACKSLVQNSYK